MPEYPTPITGLPPGRVDVLIVEDERELAEATAEYLDAMGISSHHEPTAEAALDVLSRREAGVVLLDVNRQRPVRGKRLAPDLVEQLLLRDDAAAVAHQVS